MSRELLPIDMVLFCPACGLQHIDEPDGHDQAADKLLAGRSPWDNPPHRSHLCHGCGHIWRPADVATNGVAAIRTAGHADSPKTSASLALAGQTLMRLDATNAELSARALAAEAELSRLRTRVGELEGENAKLRRIMSTPTGDA